MTKFLYAAYAVTWLIHIVYLSILGRGYKRLKEEARELDRKQVDL
jgi:CcmD family protein